MDSLGSMDHDSQQQQQQQEGGSGADAPQDRRPSGSGSSSRAVTFNAPTSSPPRQQQSKARRMAPIGPPVHHSDSFLAADGAHSSPSDLYARWGHVEWQLFMCAWPCTYLRMTRISQRHRASRQEGQHVRIAAARIRRLAVRAASTDGECMQSSRVM